ncbi:hypothetical protein GOP47_0011139 [Adiantum capillus-veneris]|uniref:Uncharacterized protein n=1 Tax=Adiantum capillus-veneris TaxID=13818 RepID=A0A9D4USQ5_ADICA|nr:hypothetical protein GOP47_0011139 [Adiantum capillus-veneris]
MWWSSQHFLKSVEEHLHRLLKRSRTVDAGLPFLNGVLVPHESRPLLHPPTPCGHAQAMQGAYKEKRRYVGGDKGSIDSGPHDGVSSSTMKAHIYQDRQAWNAGAESGLWEAGTRTTLDKQWQGDLHAVMTPPVRCSGFGDSPTNNRGCCVVIAKAASPHLAAGASLLALSESLHHIMQEEPTVQIPCSMPFQRKVLIPGMSILLLMPAMEMGCLKNRDLDAARHNVAVLAKQIKCLEG